MAINKPFDRHFFVSDTGVKKTGGSLGLSKGQLALVDTSTSTLQGAKIISTTAGYPKNKKNLELRLGTYGREVDRSHSNKSEMTIPFSLAEVRSIDVSAPKRTEQSVDEIVIGYDGFNDDSSFDFKVGDAYFTFGLEITGDKLAFRGGGQMDKEWIGVTVDIPSVDPFVCDPLTDCDTLDCKAITLEVIRQLRNRELTGGHKLTEFVDITPIFKCDDAITPTTIEYRFYELTVCDTGTDNALAAIQYQYDAPVIRTNRVGAKSTYQIFLPVLDGAPADYSQGIGSLIKGCEDCPAGYTAVEGGFLYAITREDDGADLTTPLGGNIPNVVAGTIIKSGNDNGVGFYTFVTTAKLTDSEIAALIGGAALGATATIDYVGEIDAVCTNDTVTTTAWTAGETCEAISERYTIVLPDDECGNLRTEEINAAYPQTVTATYTAASSEITLTGTSGTANVTIDGTDYLATFNTDLTTTAEDFQTAHAATILSAHGITVTAAAGVLTFAYTGNNFSEPTINNVSVDLAGTVVTNYTFDSAACQSRYEMEVVSNIVCEECDPVFKDFYTTEAPAKYDQIEWVKDNAPNLAGSTNCKCGIRIKGKTFVIDSGEDLRDQIAFSESSVKVRASAGYPEEIREGIGRLPKGQYEAKYLSRWEPRTHLGGNLRVFEDKSRTYFRDVPHYNDYLKRILTGQLSNIEENLVQYVDYSITLSHFKNSGSLAGRINEDITYHVFVEVGKHNDVEDLLNDIAANAGVSGVQAFGA